MATHSTPRIFAHQKTSLDFFSAVEKGLDLSDPGTGKTRVQIELFAKRRREGGKAALVIAPKSILRSAWENDIRKFAPQLRTRVAYAKNRAEAFTDPYSDVVITNHDAAVWLAKASNISYCTRFDTLIIDEITAFKHHTSNRSKALAKIVRFFKYRYGLTGTPTSNGMLDLWHQVFLIDDGLSLGRSFYGYRNAVCKPIQVGPGVNHIRWVDREGAEATIYSMIKDLTIRHKFEECVDIPENFTYAVPYDLPHMHRGYYEQMKKDAVIYVKSNTVSAVHAAALSTKLLQIASGAVYDEQGHMVLIDKGRYELVMDLADMAPHSIVFFQWEHQRDELISIAESRGMSFTLIDGTATPVEREEAVQGFQEGKYRVMFAHPASAAHGLTLTKGTRTIWASPLFNLEHFNQGNRRIYRAGQTHKTETIVVLGTGTIDEKVWDRLQQKNTSQQSLLDLMNELQPAEPVFVYS